MVTPKCVKCAGSIFEMTTRQVEGANFPYSFICCKSCGTVAGVVDTHNIGSLLLQLAEKLRLRIG